MVQIGSKRSLKTKTVFVGTAVCILVMFDVFNRFHTV